MKANRPPIGIMPRWIWEEKRFYELREAIARYYDAGCRIPPEWIEEYNDMVSRNVGGHTDERAT